MKMLLNRSSLWLLLCLLATGLVAQGDCESPECGTTSLNISTGVNHSTGGLYPATVPATAHDAYWNITAAPTPTLGPAWVVGRQVSAWHRSRTARWIYAFRNSLAQDQQLYTYQRCFCLCEEEEVELDLRIFADDEIVEIRLNGVPLPFNPAYDGAFNHMGIGATINDPTIILPAGQHCLEIDIRDVRSLVSGLLVEGSINAAHLIEDACCMPSGSIGGSKFHDLNGDGVWDQFREPALVGWEINIGNGIPPVRTDANGYYLFDDLPPGTYTVWETQQPGWRQTHPANNQGHTVTITGNQAFVLNFGNEEAPPIPSIIGGKKFHDLNCDGERQGNEPFLPGWTIDLFGGDDLLTPLQTLVTDENGCFQFNGLMPGTYFVSERMQDGWRQSFPFGEGHFIEITDPVAFEILFGNCLIDDPDACCEEELDERVIFHEDFETGVNVTNDYSLGSAQNPGEFAFVNSAQAQTLSSGTWDVVGHSLGGTNCDPNDQFMVVNGRTRQAGESQIYRSNYLNTIGGERYSFCVRLKHLPQCAFDVVPEVRVEVAGVAGIGAPFVMHQSIPTQVATGPDPCEYITISGTFTGVSLTSFTGCFLRIFLDETGQGEGNDLAIDEIVVRAIPHVKTQYNIQFSIDDQPLDSISRKLGVSPIHELGEDCEESWEVFEYDPADPDTPLPGTRMLGDATSTPPWGPGPHWFPGYNNVVPDTGAFFSDRQYAIIRHVDCDCFEPSTERKGFIWSVTDGGEVISLQGTDLTDGRGPERSVPTEIKANERTDYPDQQLIVSPNPFQSTFQVSFTQPVQQAGELEVYNLAGKRLRAIHYKSDTTNIEVDLSGFPAGTYLIRTRLPNDVLQQQVIKQ